MLIEGCNKNADISKELGVTKKVLVTGAGGFIGSHLVEELVKAEISRIAGKKR